MFIISLYKIFILSLRPIIKDRISNGKDKEISINGCPAKGTREWLPRWNKPLFSHALPSRSSQGRRSVFGESRGADGYEFSVRQCVGKTLPVRRYFMSANSCRAWSEAYYGLFGRGSRPYSHRTGQAKCEQSQGFLAGGYGERSEQSDVQAFFIRIGARYKRIRKRPRGIPSPQLYDYKYEKLQELEQREREGRIALYYADESHVCTEGYVPYGWQLPGEQVCIPSRRTARLNIFGMIDRKNHYQGFTSMESITADKVVSFLDTFSFSVRKDTFVVLDNATVHRNHKIRELRPVWEKRGLFLFYLPPYSPHLNIAETLWRILKGKWIRPMDYVSTDTLFYSTNRALAAVGKGLFINYSHYVA
jgi:transposase